MDKICDICGAKIPFWGASEKINNKVHCFKCFKKYNKKIEEKEKELEKKKKKLEDLKNPQNNLNKAWQISITWTLISIVLIYFFNAVPGLVVGLFQIFAVGHFIAKDAILRKRSKAHQLWAWGGLIGLMIYHLAFAQKKNKD